MLTPAQRARLDQLEAGIRDGMDAFISEIDRITAKIVAGETLTEEEQKTLALTRELFGTDK